MGLLYLFTHHGLIELLPWYLAGGTEENHDQAEIHTKYLPNTSQVCYIVTSPFSLRVYCCSVCSEGAGR